VDARAPHAMFRALRARGGAGADGGGRSLRRRVRRGVLGLICLAAAAYSARAAFFSGSDEAIAARMYHGIFPGTGGRGSADLSRVAALAASTAASTASGTTSVGAYRRPVVLVVGDSLVQRGFETNGWVASLARAYARVADVVNRGYSGYNTRWVRDLMTDDPGLFPPRRDVALAVILLGANDAARPEGRKSAYATRVEEYEENLRWIVSRFVSEADETSYTRVVLCTPPPIDEEERLRITTEQRGMPADLLDRDAERAAAYADAARRVGENTKVAVADLHAAFLKKGRGWEKALLSDGCTSTSKDRLWRLRRCSTRFRMRSDPGPCAWTRRRTTRSSATPRMIGTAICATSRRRACVAIFRRVVFIRHATKRKAS
jgi:lysophospholipase L1-like esterase